MRKQFCRVKFCEDYSWDMSFEGGQDNNVEHEGGAQQLQQGEVQQSRNSNNHKKDKKQMPDSWKHNPELNLRKGIDCSVESVEHYTVRFVNTTEKSIDLIWLDFKGEQVTYKTLSPQTAYSVFTYKVRTILACRD